jgi:DNA-binding beta-propeller fold protein YncE
MPKNPPSLAAGNGPFGVAVSPEGASLFITNSGDVTVSQYNIAVNGSLTPKSPATVPAHDGAFGIAVSPNVKRR